MIPELIPALRQLEENYEALRISLDSVPDDKLGWSPGGDTNPISVIVQHIARGNLVYATMIGPTDQRPPWRPEPSISRQDLLGRLDNSLATSRDTLAGVTAENLRESRCDDWCPNCDEQLIQGPLDAEWFALQMARHTAYHLGQVNLYLRMLDNKPAE